MLLRHTNYQTMERYLQLVDQNLRETLQLLEGGIEGILKAARAE